MISVSVREIEECLRAVSLIRGTKRVFTRVSIDTRTLKKGSLFFALKGPHFDGHNFIEDAISNGASGIVFSNKSCINTIKDHAHVTGFLVHDTVSSFQDLAKYVRNKWGKTLIAITGSCGKTTTKDLTYQLLSPHYPTIRSLGTFNNHIGLPLTLYNLTSEADYAVCELGMNHEGEIGRLTRIAYPDIGVITNVGAAHLGFFSSIDNIAQAKEELLKSLQPGKTAIINADNPWTAAMKDRYSGKSITFGIYNNADFMAKEITTCRNGQNMFTLFERNKKIASIMCPLAGEFNVYNLLSALSIARTIGLSYNEILKTISHLKASPMRWQRFHHNKRLFIIDTYNANPTSVSEAIKTLSSMNIKGKKICILGDMLELGNSAKRSHRETGKLVADHGITLLIAHGMHANDYCDGFSSSKNTVSKCVIGKDHDDIARHLSRHTSAGDAILIKGSRNCLMEKVYTEYKKL